MSRTENSCKLHPATRLVDHGEQLGTLATTRRIIIGRHSAQISAVMERSQTELAEFSANLALWLPPSLNYTQMHFAEAVAVIPAIA